MFAAGLFGVVSPVADHSVLKRLVLFSNQMIMRKVSIRRFFFLIAVALLGSIPLLAQETCPKPVNIRLVGAAQTTATIGWDLSDNTIEPNHYLLTLKQGETVIHEALPIDDGEHAHKYMVTGLTANAEYSLWLETDATDLDKGKSGQSDMFTFRTLCDYTATSFPYVNDFESKDEPLACWVVENSGNTQKISSNYYHGSGQSGQSVILYATSSVAPRIVSPQFNFAADSMEVTFWYYSTKNTKFSAGIMTDPYDVNTFVALYNDSVETANEWTEVRFNTKDYAGTGVGAAIAIALPSGTQVTMYIDDFSCIEKPLCSRPERLEVMDIDSTSVLLAWKDYENAGSYEIQVDEQTPVTVSQNPYLLTGLDKKTPYSVKVRNVCSAGVYSEWSKPVAFTTRCGTAPTTEFEQNFDNVQDIPECWFQVPTVGSGSWSVNNRASYANSGSQSVKYTYNVWGEARSLLVLQPVAVGTPNSYDLSFEMYRQYSSSNYYRKEGEGVYVWVSNTPDITDPSAVNLGMVHNHLSLSPVEGSNSTGFYHYEFAIPLSGTVYVIFEAVNLAGYDTYLDDIKVQEAPKCRPVSNIRVDKDRISTTSVGIEWDRHKVSTSTQYLVDITTEPASSVTMQETVTGTSYTVQGLSPSTLYTITARIAASCGADGNAEYVEQRLVVSTACEPSSVFPVAQGFNSEVFPPLCWSVRQTVAGEGYDTDLGDNAWSWQNAESGRQYVYSGSGAAKFNECRKGTHANLISPAIDFGAQEGDYVVSYYQYRKSYGYEPEDGIRVWVNSTPDTVNATLLKFVPSDSNEDPAESWVAETYDEYAFCKYEWEFKAQGVMYVIFEGITNDGDYRKAQYIDDVRIYPKPDCEFLDIAKTRIDSVQTDAARITMTDPTIRDWSVSYGPVGFDPNSGTVIRVTEGYEALLTGLTADTRYEYYVRLHCKGGTAAGFWSETSVEFKTDCSAFAVTPESPFCEGFEEFYDGETLAGCYVTETTQPGSFNVVAGYEDYWDDINVEPAEGERLLLMDKVYSSPSKAWVYRSFDLKAGKNYAAGMMLREEYDYTDRVFATFGYGRLKSSDAMTIVASLPVVNDEWNEYFGYFNVPEDGVYVVGFGVENLSSVKTFMDSITLTEVECIPPVNVRIEDLMATSATVAFDSEADGWELKVSSVEFDPETGAADVFQGRITGKQKVLAGILPNTQYYYSLRSFCDGKPSGWLALGNFRTLCEKPAIPYIENFNDSEGNSLNCWQFIENSPWGGAYIDDSHSRSGLALAVQGITAISPEFDVQSLAGYELSGWVYDSGYGNNSFQIGVLNSTDPDEFEATFQPLTTVTLTEGKTWYDFSVRFDDILDPDFVDAYGNSFADARQFVIFYESTGSYYLYFDDLTIVPASGCAKVMEAEINEDELGAFSCTADWIAGGDEAQWQMVAMKDGEIFTTKVVDEHPAVIDGLDALTQYELYVRAICAVGDTSGMRYVGRFTTGCDSYSLPYDNSFGAGNLTCWEAGLAVPTDGDKSWSVESGKLKANIESGGDMTSYYTPYFKFAPGEEVMVSFDVEFPMGDSVGIYLLENDGQLVERFNNRVDVITTNSESAVHKHYDVTGLLSGNCNEFRIVFAAWNNKKGNYDYKLYIDNLTVENILPCTRPVSVLFDAIGVDSVTATVNDTVASHTAWQYVLVPAGGDIAGIEPVDAGMTFTHKGLVGETRYEVYVRAVCGENAESGWRGPYGFTTNCMPKALPYRQDFEDIASFELGCYTVTLNQVYGQPTVELSTYGGNKAPRNLRFTASPYAENNGEAIYGIVALPEMARPVNELKMKFYLKNGTNDGALSVGVILDPANVNSYRQLTTLGSSSSYTLQEVSFADIPAEFADGYIAFKLSDGGSKYVNIDDIEVYPLDYCDVPTSLAVTAFGETNADLAWQNPVGVTECDYLLETADGTEVGNGQFAKGVTTASFTMLSPGTAYRFSVRSSCSASNKSEWTSVDFRTVNATPKTFPYATGFEAADDNDQWVLVNGSEPNRFMVGADAAGVEAGQGALYITRDDVSNNYDISSASVVYAYRTLRFAPGQYLISYKWKSVGDYSYDYARVFFAPVDWKLAAGTDSYVWNKNVLANGLYPLDGGKALRRQYTWMQQYAEITVKSDTLLNLVVAWQNNASGGSQTPFAFDNLVVEKVNCPMPANLAVTSLSDESVTVRFENMAETDEVIYAVSASNDVAAASLVDTMTLSGSGMIVVDKLQAAKDYWMFVRAHCDDIHNSSWVSVGFKTLNKAASVPYVTGFADDAENAQWQMAYGSADVNNFVIGSDKYAAGEDTRALYISNDGTSYGYNGNTASRAYAYRLIDMPKGLYNITYDWTCVGEMSGNNGNVRYNDYARVFLAPVSVVVKAGADLFGAASLAEGCIALDDDKALAGYAEWKHVDKTVLMRDAGAGKYCLVVAWINDANAQFVPVAVDNFSITQLPCAPVMDITLDEVDIDKATISFYNINESEVVYGLTTSDNMADIPADKFMTGDGSVLNLTGLTPNTRYTLFVKAKCSDTDESEWASFVFSTACVPVDVNESASYSTSFEELSGLFGLDNCWTESAGELEWRANSNTTGNRKPRTGSMNIVMDVPDGNTDAHTATRRFNLNGGKFYQTSIWGVKDADGEATFEFVDCTSSAEGVAFETRALTDAYTNITGYFYAPADGIYDLGFRVAANDEFVSLDDYSVSLLPFGAPRNFVVGNITGESADFSWIVNADSTKFTLTSRGVEIKDVTVTGTSLSVGGLTAATSYTATIVAYDGTVESDPVTLKFFTDCGITPLPYMQTFQDAYGSDIPACWDNFSGTVLTDDNYNWAVGSNGTGKYARLSTSGAYGTAVLKTPVFNVDADNYALSFKYVNTSEHELVVSISEDGGATFSQNLETLAPGNDWQTKLIELSGYNGKEIVVAFKVRSEGKGNGLYVGLDDVRIAKYAGEKKISDTHCSGSDYYKNGFAILRTDIKLGTNTFTKLVMSDIENPVANVLDTLKVLTLNVNETQNIHVYGTICEGGVYDEAPFTGDKAKSEAGDWVISYTAGNGCDSNVILHLTVLPEMYYVSETICEGDVFEFGGQQCTATGSYVAYGKNYMGCDSNVTLRLEVLPARFRQYKAVCEGEVYEWVEAKQTLTETKVYSHAFKNYLGCDSIVEIDFHVVPTNVRVDTTICAGSSIIFGEGADAEELSVPGTYTKTFKNSLKCDSVVTLRLSVADPIISEYDDIACENRSYENYGFRIPVITKDTVLTKTITNADGCDSTVVVNIEFVATIYTDSIATIKQGESFIFCGSSYTTAGEYTCGLQSEETGCDSIIRLTLNVETGVENVMALSLVVAPNPVRGGESAFVSRDWTAEEQDGMIVEILNSVGQVIMTDSPSYFPIEINSVTVSGIYYIRVITGTGGVYVGKLIVK